MREREGPAAKRWEGEGLKTRYSARDGAIERARKLRREATPAEEALWSVLRGSQLGGMKFRRQQRIGPFDADFARQAEKLVIEVDGDTHANSVDYDARRTAFLERAGYHVIRFTNADVLNNIGGVAEAILVALGPSPSQAFGLGPSLSLKGRGA